jgi:hypothetical protein
MPELTMKDVEPVVSVRHPGPVEGTMGQGKFNAGTDT